MANLVWFLRCFISFNNTTVNSCRYLFDVSYIMYDVIYEAESALCNINKHHLQLYAN